MFPVIAFVTMAAVTPPMEPVRTQAFGQWRVAFPRDNATTGRGWAYTDSGPGAQFGISCNQYCKYYLALPISCAEGGAYSIFANGTKAAEIPLRCVNRGGLHIMIVEDDSHLRQMLAGSAISFAFPLDDGHFNVTRFSLVGAKQAMAVMLDRWKQAGTKAQAPEDGNKTPEPGLKDSTL